MVRPKKHLGQHFLKDKNIARKIAGCLSGDFNTVCEIGPGTGILTSALLEREEISHLKLIEIDTESVEYLQTHFHDERMEIIEADFLKTDLTRISDKPFALIGNYPYNISSQIFFKALNNRDLIPEISGMIQKEVAERMIARPGSKTYGILSVLLQTWYDIKYCFTVNENVFFPPPKVKSAVIKMTRNEIEKLACDEKLYTEVVKTAFNQRRKTLRNSLKKLLPDHVKGDTIFDKRPEQLSIPEFIGITQRIEADKTH
jgi:16S rRNA (adenine1518-N6/adenine1519-N6)-dimethyltransferase